ncbi:MAG: methyltransferase domain-containing protein [Alphaproteobacteria bacterium]|nr:methyltransferase domain-containing protein [Alphaproteobacteria bacterium]
MSGALRYARFNFFRRMMGPFSKKTRQRRMAQLEGLLNLRSGMKILDLGGQPDIWDFVTEPLDITILNLPGIALEPPANSIHQFEFMEGDACNVTAYDDKSFDAVFSNSVIEHVGDESKQRAFANEVRRLSEKYWVQTPSIWFPIEAHTGMPFWFLIPSSIRARCISSWGKKLPDWTEMVKGTTVLSKRQMRDYFPTSTFIVERKFYIPKSYIAYKA